MSKVTFPIFAYATQSKKAIYLSVLCPLSSSCESWCRYANIEPPYRKGRSFEHMLAWSVNAQFAAFSPTPTAAFGALVCATPSCMSSEGSAQKVGEGYGTRLRSVNKSVQQHNDNCKRQRKRASQRQKERERKDKKQGKVIQMRSV